MAGRQALALLVEVRILLSQSGRKRPSEGRFLPGSIESFPDVS